jgi:hypothetical protein
LAAAGSADAATANDVVLWACHGPSGQPLGTAPFLATGTTPTAYGSGCGPDAGTTIDAGGLRAQLASATGGASRLLTVSVPPDLTLKSVTLSRRTSGFGNTDNADKTAALAAGGSQSYTAKVDGTTIESATLGSSGPLDGDVTLPATGRRLDVGVSCDAPINDSCPGNPIGVDLQKVGLRATDDSDPVAAVGGVGSDASGDLRLDVWATDVGAGLDRAEAWVDGQLAVTGFYGDGTCKDLTPSTAQVDLPLGANCPSNGRLTLTVKTQTTDPVTDIYPDGDHTLTVKLYDASGREVNVVDDHVFKLTNHPNPGNSSATLAIGSGTTPQQSGSSGSGGTGSGGVAGATATSCNSPKLSLELSQKPLKVSNGVPVLKYGKRYRFRGRLTCVVNGKRRSAAPSTRIDLLNTVGKRTLVKGGTTVRAAGKITIILAYKSSRTLIFRYTNPDGRRSQVKLKIKVVK